MKVFKKLQQARVNLINTPLKKSGKNKFAGFEYFELGDFVPCINKIFNDIGLCGVVHFTSDCAILTIYDTEDGNSIEFRSPMVYAENAKGQAIQSLGATHTYMRRYLWLMAMEIVENDVVDAGEQPPKKAEPKPEHKEPQEEKPKPKPVAIKGKDTAWQINVDEKEPGVWQDIVLNAVDAMIGFAESKKDVLQIFKVNRNIFDKLQAEQKETYDTIIAKLGVAKTSLPD
jgi:hypothetical protein